MQFHSYLDQVRVWPNSGRHIMAQFDDESIYVYQAYRPAIARLAVEHQRFGGEFSFSRMSWIKPNFLWMMYRSGWATKEGQEHVLAVRIRRAFFDELLRSVVPSSFDSRNFATVEEWKIAVGSSEVRLQWDPDHDPLGRPLERRAVQLGLRGSALRRFGEQELISIEDITTFVAEQRLHLRVISQTSKRQKRKFIVRPISWPRWLSGLTNAVPTEDRKRVVIRFCDRTSLCKSSRSWVESITRSFELPSSWDAQMR